MITETITPELATALNKFIKAFGEVDTVGDLAPALSCVEVDYMADLFRAAGQPEAADAWKADHEAAEGPCDCTDTDDDE
ncbi:hypothetical protein ACGF3G_00645 [Streptomyces sp. NPDC048179]|uniref:hypothetical protein n=1 Tax=Streptomyces sp. NPDC048179 TaxID=3365506 RepID=UPI00371A2DD3